MPNTAQTTAGAMTKSPWRLTTGIILVLVGIACVAFDFNALVGLFAVFGAAGLLFNKREQNPEPDTELS